MTVVDSRVRQGSLTLDGTSFSCQPTSASIVADHQGTDEDNVEVLCGDIAAGASTQTLAANLTVTSIQDFTSADGLTAFSWANDGAEVPFTWNPGPDPLDEWSGKCIVKALTVGGDVKVRLTNDLEWKITYLTTPTKMGGQVVIGGDTSVAITGVTAGTPGSFQPAGATIPANLAALKADPVVGDSGTNKPVAAWTTGQYVNLVDASSAHWDGTVWQTGVTP